MSAPITPAVIPPYFRAFFHCILLFVFLIMIFIAINGPMKQRKEPKKSHNKIVVPFSVNDRP